MDTTRDDHDLAIARPWSLGPRAATVALLVILPALLILEWMAGTAFSQHLFYVLPISLAAWNFGYRIGFAIATVAAVYSIFVALAMRPPTASFLPLLWQAASTIALFLVIAAWVAYHRRFIEKVTAASRLDIESGALAPREIERLLESEANRARRYHRPLSLMMIELAAEQGNRKLSKALVDALRRNVRDCDAVGRLTRRRYVLLLIECPAVEAGRVAARCRQVVAEALPKGASFSLGAVSYGGATATNAPHLLHMAEAHMVGAKTGTLPENSLPQLA